MRPQPDRVIPVRRVRPRFDDVEGRLWFGGDRFRTALFNAYTMLLCDEFEFVAIARDYLPAIRDEHLRRQLKSWLGQEAAHGVQHRKACDYLDRVGLRYRGFHKVENFLVFRFLFPLLGRKLRIALIAALEHINTLMGEMCLRRPDYFARANRELGLLLSWHFAEEIEHRAVIHDVADAAGVGYVTRITVGAFAFALYSGVLFATTFWFAAQSSDLLRPSTYVQWFRFMFVDERFAQFMLAYARAYLSPHFHPLKRDSDHFAEAVFRRLAPARTVAGG
ncbi:metal-dependent hydrolase [Burkholderia thailandensis]|uniref:Metal-dependent hydrolase n=1 Tax=Burkholderia thailandensis (strain ATCC 700388 / DSM 13276 / CCUG 48851 / CIP 106301 / E264) TaxID=271848 RepID=Q2T8J5_BURTA|nr:metal-dependent hydrolase [Burkholderia thailandensis]ABC36172.1 conserved hypothetical protein [Burkholderia thailandensis E264]AHI74947.1 putative metal-dependent hydrolase family protein [Burkholderia thailandensis 2002721723]AHI80664.1 putative metal-dependent hydrolase family protein [Burkholderia thailandensis E444]AIC89031.1 putative metal-dependent hydrolase family protein [Burkholderia thailandensis USAMRU Malaysia \